MVYILKDDGVVDGATCSGQRLDVLTITSGWTGFQVPFRTIVVRRAGLVYIVSLAILYWVLTSMIPSFAIGICPTEMVGQPYINRERPCPSVCRGRHLRLIYSIWCTNGPTSALDEQDIDIEWPVWADLGFGNSPSYNEHIPPR